MNLANIFLYSGLLSFIIGIYKFSNNRKFSIYLFIYCIIAYAFYYTYSGAQLIDNQKAKNMIESNKIDYIIDIRTELEWNLGHHPKALHIPVSKLNSKYLPKNSKNKKFLLYCNSGQRARKGAEILKKQGYNKVYYVANTYKQIM